MTRDAVDSRAYTEAKTDFIRGIDRRAIAWLETSRVTGARR
ncbi:MAG TPA: hypothetical protein PLX31_08015 [Gemmatimonadaceae bacterium]|jgi:hypothetical protein|nr:hypothetical protein [Gemmatimonadaceae bacterium]